MDVSFNSPTTGRDSVYIITPRLIGDADSIDFPEVALYGRNPYYYNVRNGGTPGTDRDANLIRYKDGPRTEHYARTIGHQPWMDNSRLKLLVTRGNACWAFDQKVAWHDAFSVPAPDTTYVTTQNKEQEELTGHVSGRANIQFIVNRTEFVPELRNNKRELDKMRRSIDEVRANPDVRITKYRLKGYASPEGPYDNNVRLALGRTERLREFVIDRWGVPASQVDIDYEPEDWVGFRNYVDSLRDQFPHAQEIIGIIDTDEEPDARLARIQRLYPQEYQRVLTQCFPYLRRTDYTIDYEWLTVVERNGRVDVDTIITPGTPPPTDDPLEDDILTVYRPTRPWLALKTNVLFDLAGALNFELEAQLGRDSRWSLMLEDWFPWWLYKRNYKGDTNPYRRTDWKAYRHAYEIWNVGAELRYWFRPRCAEARPTLTGSFLGAYVSAGKYDWEWDGTGNQGEFTSFGLSIGHSWALSRAWNLELSAAAGFVGGPRRHYDGEFDDSRLIWKYTGRMRYVGPTKLKLSLVWLVPNKPKRKGGEP